MGNSESRPHKSEVAPEQNNNITVNQPNHEWKHAVNGNTEELSVKPNVTHAAFETTSEEVPFTESEKLAPMPISTSKTATISRVVPASKANMTSNMQGGFIFDKLASLLQDTETNVFDMNSGNDVKLNKIRSLLNDTETNDNVLVGGGSQSLRELLLQDSESFLNFRGGNHDKKTHHEKSEKLEEVKEDEEEKPEVSEVMEEMKKDEDEDEEKEEKKEEETEKSNQSGGEELDTELKVILKELQTNNNHKGGKSSRKSSKKSNKSKKQSRRNSTESAMTNGTYDIDTDDDEDYLTSTTSMNTSDIDIKHYRS
jgi:hypothetical protein